VNLKFDKISSLVFFILGLFIFLESRKISQSTLDTAIGPGVFPAVIGIALMVLSVVLFIETIKFKKIYKIIEKETEKESNDEESQSNKKVFFIIIISTFLYILLLEKIGYVITTFLFLFVAFQTLERSKWITSFIVAALFTGTIYVGFVKILGGNLPGLPF